MTGRASRLALVAIVATLALAVVIFVVSTVLDSLPGATGTAADRPAGSSLSSDQTDTPTDATPDGKAGTSPSDSAEGDSSSGSSGTGSSDDRTSSEVLPAPDKKSPIGLPPSPPLTPLVTSPLPPTASAANALVEGFPTEVISLNPDTTVQSSSVASAENRLQVTLAATTPSPSEAVLEHYRVSLAEQKLVDSVAPAAAGSTALLFSRGVDTILLTVTPTESGGTTYSVFGAFTAAT
jgi:hypothetical protein